jgi:hypothetical protein
MCQICPQRLSLLFSALAILDVGRDTVPFKDLASLIPQRNGSRQKPMILLISFPPVAHLILEGSLVARDTRHFSACRFKSAALRRRAIEGGSNRVVVLPTRTVLWLLSMRIFDKAYAHETTGSTDEHAYVTPDLFTAETPLRTYQGLADPVLLSWTPGSFRTVLVPRGSSKPDWLAS